MHHTLLFIVILAALAHPCHAADGISLFKKIAPSVFVVISKSQTDQVLTQGSGIAVSPGTIVTNCHVLEGGNKISVVQQAKEMPARRKHSDLERDLCTLVVSVQNTPIVVPLSPSRTLSQGQSVWAVGAPLGLELTISNGIVSGLRQTTNGFIIQTSAAISPGSSGGGLFNEEGQLVGITTFQYKAGQSLNFAVPSEWIQQIETREVLETKLRERRESFETRVSTLEATSSELIRISREALQTDQLFIPALYRLGLAQWKLSSPEAEGILARLIKQRPHSIDDIISLGLGAMYLSSIYEKQSKYDLARSAGSLSVEYFPFELSLGQYWSLLTSRDHYRDALPVLKSATSTHSMSPHSHAYLGGAFLNLQQYREAAQSFQIATKIKPDYEWAWFGYIVSLRESQQTREMEQVIKSLYDTNPSLLERVMKPFGRKQ